MSNEDKGLLKQMETDSQLHKVKDIDVDEIANLCQSAADLQRECDELEQQLKNKRQKLNKHLFEVIPNALAERNLTSLKLVDGSEVDIQSYYTAKIPKESEQQAYKWLRDNGFGDLIKNEVVVQFGRDEDGRANNFVKSLVSDGYEPTQKTHVHPQTLRGFIREQMESGKNLPLDILGGYAGQRATIKNKGGK